MAIIEAMQDQKKILAAKIQDYESNLNNDEENQSELSKQIAQLQIENERLKEQIGEQTDVGTSLKALDDEKEQSLLIQN